jgi:thymidylate kinase
MNGLIIEGVAGTGKSSTLKHLEQHPDFLKLYPKVKVLSEEITLGELVIELRNESLTNAQRCLRLKNLLPEIEATVSARVFVILERFHHSYFALMPDWNLVKEYDAFLNHLKFASVLLDIPDNLIAERCFNRPENGVQGTGDLMAWYGSKTKAMKAFATSQNNRKRAMEISLLPGITVDTSEKNWNEVVERIIKFMD